MHPLQSDITTLFREEINSFDLPSGATRSLQWTVYPENAAYNLFVLFRAYLFDAYPLPSRTASCGIVVIHTTALSGVQVIVLLIFLHLLFVSLGYSMWYRQHAPFTDRSKNASVAMLTLAIIVLGGLLTALIGWWGAGILLLVLAVLLAITVITYFVQYS